MKNYKEICNILRLHRSQFILPPPTTLNLIDLKRIKLNLRLFLLRKIVIGCSIFKIKLIPKMNFLNKQCFNN